MGGEWQSTTIGEHFDLVNGYAFKSKEFLSKGVPVIKIKNVKAGYFSEHGFSYVASYFLTKRKDKLAKPGDLLITMSGNRHDGSPSTWVGKVAYFDKTDPFFINQRVGALRLKSESEIVISRRFMAYLLSSWYFQELFISIATSSGGQANISPAQILSAPFKAPLYTEQRAIAHILGTLDDKIELNRQMNRTLEAMAQALFRSWFIDFDPVVVNALHAGNPVPEKFAQRAAHYRDNPDALRLPEDTLRLFPDRFRDSELGPIPEGWEVKPIGDLVKCVGGATPSTKKPEFWEGGTNPFLTPKDMASLDSPVVLDTERHITDAGVEKISSKKLPIGTVLLSSRAPIGYLAINEVPVSVNQGIIAMICDGPLPNHYVFFWTKNNMDVIKGKAGGTTFAEISKKNFRPIPALQPSEKVLDAFTSMAGLLYQQLVENTVSCVTLAKLRDTLLPKLVSGELRVPDAEKLVEDAS